MHALGAEGNVPSSEEEEGEVLSSCPLLPTTFYQLLDSPVTNTHSRHTITPIRGKQKEISRQG